ncbi:hypothetical protein E3P99_03148 [Wallemia hederae]|uniref:mRNA 3'-end-processing protein YTH1 n=1 Tax=Wallemia hederae TaxID=1540922 RepID=A0A4T0FIV8_9BASI|nr:hypothetical protein E3P99_03148 [Wallemia hederae]
MAIQYRHQLQQIAPNTHFVMTLYLSPSLTPEEIHKAAANGVTGVKSYPRGVTTNSDGGIESYEVYYPVFEAMQDANMVLNLHGEVPSSEDTGVTVINAEERFLPQLDKLAHTFPRLRIVVEHATTKAAVDKVKSLPDNVGCSITPHHLQLIVDDWAGQGFNFCKPVAKFWEDRQALRDVIKEGHPRFFLGSDSAPHPRDNKLNKAPRLDAQTNEAVPACACAAGLFTSAILIPLCAHLLESFGALHRLQDFLERFAKQELGLKLDRDSQICQDNLTAAGCPRGASCPLRHTDPSPKNFEPLPPLPTNIRERERAVTICKHWLRGLCKKGDSCEFLHEYDLRKMPECWWFVKWGWCANGEECLYRHTPKEGRKAECPEYLRGFCKRGPYCPFKHVRRAACLAYLAGYCPDGPECLKGHPKSRLPKPYTLADADPPPVPDPELGPPPGYMGYSYERGPWESRRFGAGFGGEPGQGIAHGIGPGGVSHGRPQSYRGEKMVPSGAGSGPGEPFIRNVNQKPRDNQNAQVRRGLENILCFKCGQHGHYANQCPNKVAPGLLEEERNAHSEIEQYEEYMVELFLDTARGQKKQMAQKQQMAKISERMLDRREFLKKSYASTARDDELTIIGPSQIADDLNVFYERLSSVKDYHRKNPNTPIDAFAMEIDGFRDELDKDAVSALFSGEEAYGKFLDLHLAHDKYLNLRNIPKRLNYLQYLDEFEQVEELPVQVKRQAGYADYLNALVTYLESFLHRSRPLDDYSEIQLDTLKKFDEQWKSGTAPGWPDDADGQSKQADSQGVYDPVMQRVYTNMNVYNNVKKSKKYQNALKRLEESGGDVSAKSEGGGAQGGGSGEDKAAQLRKSKDRTLASQEALLRLYATILAGVRKDTKAEIERKSALTAREREQELDEAEYEEYKANPIEEVVEDEKDDEGKIYNPLKLPLGWDGKPIPFWLFKLHGLGVEYECEICSGKVYNGRKNFEKHFQEGTHAYGMRALGLPNTKHFHEITKIADALALAEKLKIQGRQENQASATVEEIEDEQGNVYDVKTYNQLKKQGLL